MMVLFQFGMVKKYYILNLQVGGGGMLLKCFGDMVEVR